MRYKQNYKSSFDLINTKESLDLALFNRSFSTIHPMRFTKLRHQTFGNLYKRLGMYIFLVKI
jgi:hypothetical protein